MTIVGELTAGTAAPKKASSACRTCGIISDKLSPGGHCWDPTSCAARRIARVSKEQHLRAECIVQIRQRGATYYVREFGPKILPPPNPLPKGFTLEDYQAKPDQVFYEAAMERGAATRFKLAKALALAKAFDGIAVNP